MRFVAIDFETANARLTSICQAGIVVFEDGREVLAESMLINPQDYFEPRYVKIHGIEADQIMGQPTFPEAFGRIAELLQNEIAVSHTTFDRTTLTQACRCYSIQPVVCRWLDSARIARRAWPQFAQSGYGLGNLAREFSITFKHHDAVQDARVAGLILLKAISESGTDLDGWFARVERPGSGNSWSSERVKLEGGTEGPLVGEVCVFTGELQISRREAAELANKAGGAIDPGVTKKTTLVIVGNQDLDRLAGKQKSAKHLKAEDMAAKGFPIRIIQESDFMALVAN